MTRTDKPGPVPFAGIYRSLPNFPPELVAQGIAAAVAANKAVGRQNLAEDLLTGAANFCRTEADRRAGAAQAKRITAQIDEASHSETVSEGKRTLAQKIEAAMARKELPLDMTEFRRIERRRAQLYQWGGYQRRAKA